MSRNRSGALVLAVVAAVAALTGCSVLTAHQTAAPPTGVPFTTVPETTSPPTMSATSAPPAPTPTPTVAPTPPPKPKPTSTQAPGSVHQVSQTIQKGHGPAGSMMSTGTSGVALTFDDGPDPVYTPKMLDLLKKYHVKATFCLIGTNVRANPALVARIVAEGHTICNHSWQHRLDLGTQTDAVILKDLSDTNAVILKAAPKAKIKYFRAPGGNFTPNLVADAASLGMKSIYWAIDPRDWDAKTWGHGTSMVNHIVSVVEGHVRPGSIVLSHDAHKPDTLTAYKTLLPWLLARYKLIPLPT